VLGYVAVGRGDFPLAGPTVVRHFSWATSHRTPPSQAWVRGCRASANTNAGQYDAALRLAEDGLNYAEFGPQSVRLTINGIAGRSVNSVMLWVFTAPSKKPTLLMSRNDVPSGVPSSIAFECYSAAQTASNAATAYVALGMPEKVQHYVGLALPDVSTSESPWSRSLVMIDLALSPDPPQRGRSGSRCRACPRCAPNFVRSPDNLGAAADFGIYPRGCRALGKTRQVSAVLNAVSALKRVDGQGELSSSHSRDFATAEELERFRNVRWLRNHWARLSAHVPTIGT